jgi:metal-dependent hydrolase (beta-lactamase superfamily II)
MKLLSRLIFALLFALLALIAFYSFKHANAVAKVEEAWQQTSVDPLPDFGETQSLHITPLVNWHAARPGLKTEAGVSYLIQTDQHQLLFDVGFNRGNEAPSPLEHNMATLGLELATIDTLFLSHHHLDHSGGQGWVDRNTLSPGQQQPVLGDTRIFAPAALQYPGSQVQHVSGPMAVGEGLASIGPIRRQLFMGEIQEQALAINVAGKGIVLIVGCGHQTLPKILKRFDQLFDAPLYGIIGDLHYPVPEGRLKAAGINLQRVLASGTGPWAPITADDVQSDLQLLSARNPGVVGLGGHDTSDEVIEQFAQHFGSRYQRVLVGQAIEIK